MNKKIRKLQNICQALHPKSNVDRLCLECSERGKGLLSLEKFVSAEKRPWGQYLKMINEDENPKVYRDKTSKSQMEE